MKIIKGEKRVTEKKVNWLNDYCKEEVITYECEPDKKILERSDRFIVTKADGILIKKNHVFMVTTVGEHQHNIISLENGNVYYGEPADTIEELSQWIIEDFEDFKVVPLKVHLLPDQSF